MARFEDIKLNDIVTIEFDGINANFKVLVIHNNPGFSRVEIVALATDDVSHISDLISLSGSMIVNNIKNIEDNIKKKNLTNDIKYVSDIENHSKLYIFHSSENKTKLVNIKGSNIINPINKVNDFLICKSCKDPIYMAGPNQNDGSFLCYSCRTNPIRIYY